MYSAELSNPISTCFGTNALAYSCQGGGGAIGKYLTNDDLSRHCGTGERQNYDVLSRHSGTQEVNYNICCKYNVSNDTERELHYHVLIVIM